MLKNIIRLIFLVTNQRLFFAFVPLTETNHSLVGHVFRTYHAQDWLDCLQSCNQETQCISYNYEKSALKNGLCELNNCGLADLCTSDKSLVYSPGFVYQQLRDGESACNLHNEASTCKEVYDNNVSHQNKAYLLSMPTGKVPVYCHMTDLGACGGGGWTLVMKINGREETFHYNSTLWSNKITFNTPGGRTGFDKQQTKLPTYWNTAFSKICLGMMVGDHLRFIKLTKAANSLYSLIADGKHHPTSLGRDTWKSLIGSQTSLQRHCIREGFNVVAKLSSRPRARIGIIANNENNCWSLDSRIGFGTGGLHDDKNTCGNEARYAADNGDKHIKAMGYILVQ